MTARLLLTAAALLPALALAVDPAPAAAPPAPPAQVAPAAPAAPAAAAPATTAPATAAPAEVKPPEPEFSSYAVLKGGWFGSSGDYQGSSFSGSGTWEVAVGTGRIVGVELGFGSMSTSASSIEVTTYPLLLSLRLQIPVAFVAPYVELGGGAYFNQVTVGGRSFDDVTAGWQAGLGCDFLLGRLLLGAEARYMGIAPTISTVGTLTLDRYELLVRAGVRF